MSDAVQKAWSQVVATARRTVADGLVVGTSGNVSARVGDLVLVTPTGVPYDRLGPGDLVAVDAATGRQVRGTLLPTSELPTHLAVYHGTPARAIVHTHAPHATAVSTLERRLPPVHYATAALGGVVRVAGYALYGTDELAAEVLTALRDGRTACLMRNHGTLAYGDTLDQAYDRTAQLEWMCRVWLLACSADASPHLLSKRELERVAHKLQGYGQPAGEVGGGGDGAEAEAEAGGGSGDGVDDGGFEAGDGSRGDDGREAESPGRDGRA